MQIRLLLFAAHREAVGTNQLEITVPEGTTAGDLYGEMERREPALQALRRYTSFAVNREVVPAGTRLHPGDEVAFLQPVSGGSCD